MSETINNLLAVRFSFGKDKSIEIDLLELQFIMETVPKGKLVILDLEVFVDDKQTAQIGPFKLRGINNTKWNEMGYPCNELP